MPADEPEKGRGAREAVTQKGGRQRAQKSRWGLNDKSFLALVPQKCHALICTIN